MKTYFFTVILRDVPELTEDVSEVLFEAGCDDGSPYSRGGTTGVRMAREAQSLEHAIASAIADIRKAGHDMERVEIDHAHAADLEVIR